MGPGNNIAWQGHCDIDTSFHQEFLFVNDLKEASPWARVLASLAPEGPTGAMQCRMLFRV